MARRLTGRHRAVIAPGLHPHYLGTINTYLGGQGDHASESAQLGADGRAQLAAVESQLADDVACVVVQTPNFFGVVEDLKKLGELAHQHGALLVAVTTEPAAFGVLAPPGALGADIAVGEGIGLAIPPSLGGPGVGLFAAKAEHTRQMPGRLVGETVDKEGRRGYVLTLATREQHIRREKATSNICTNQGLIALAFSIHLALLGKRGFTELAQLNLAKAEYAKQQLSSLRGFSLAYSGPTFNEFTVRVRGGDARKLADALAERGIYAGVPVSAPGLLAGHDDQLIVTVTERHSRADIDKLARSLDEVAQ
jgi:glycine dehydrogenase subunit 1